MIETQQPSPIQTLFESLSSRNPQLKENGFENFAEDMQDEENLSKLYQSLSAKQPQLKEHGFDNFKSDMWNLNPSKEEATSPETNPIQEQPLTYMQKELRKSFPENYKDEQKPVVAKNARTEKDGFGTELGQQAKQGTNEIVAAGYGMPGYAYDFVGSGLRALGLNVPEYRDSGFTNDINIAGVDVNPLSILDKAKDSLLGFAKQNAEKVRKINPDIDRGVLEPIQNGEYQKGLRNLFSSMTQSAPASAAMMLSGGLSAPIQVGAGAALFGSQNLNQADQEGDYGKISRDAVVAISSVTGALESIFETSFGSGAAGKAIANIVKADGEKAAVNTVKKGFTDNVIKMITENPWMAPFGEAYEEMGTQLAQNAVNKYSGYKPETNLMDGVYDAGIMGFGMGSVHGGMIGAAKKTFGDNPSPEQFGSQPTNQPTQAGPVSETPQLTVDPRQEAEATFRGMGENFAHKETGNITMVTYVTSGLDKNVPMFIVQDAGDGSFLLQDEKGNRKWATNDRITGNPVELSVDDFVAQKMADFDQQSQAKDLDNQNKMIYKNRLVKRSSNPEENKTGDSEFWFDDQSEQEVEIPNEVVQDWEKRKVEAPDENPNMIETTYGRINVVGTKDDSGNITVSEPANADYANDLRKAVEKETGGNASVEAELIPNDDKTAPQQYKLTIVPKQLDIEAELLENKPSVQEQPEPIDQLFSDVDPKLKANVEAEIKPSYIFNGQPIDQRIAKARVNTAIEDKNINKLAGLEINNDPELSAAIEKAFPKPKAKYTFNGKVVNEEKAIDRILAADDVNELNQLKIENPDAATNVLDVFNAKMEELNPQQKQNSVVLPVNSQESNPENISKTNEISPANQEVVTEKGQSNNVDTSAQVDQAVSKVNTNPTEAQKKAGNYKMAHIQVQGMDITIENPKGSFRSGTDEDGRAWKTEMKSHYGYFKGTTGKDGDQIDAFIGENPESQTVFVVDQNHSKTGGFDESKVMLGYNSPEEAKAAYMANYEPEWKGFGSITPVGVEQFKTWLNDGARQRKPFAGYVDTPAPVNMDSSVYNVDTSVPELTEEQKIEEKATEVQVISELKQEKKVKPESILKEQKTQLIEDLLSAEDILLGENLTKGREEHQRVLDDKNLSKSLDTDAIIEDQYEYTPETLPEESIKKLNDLGIKIVDWNLGSQTIKAFEIDVYKDGSIKVASIRSAINAVNKRFPMRTPEKNHLTNPSNLKGKEKAYLLNDLSEAERLVQVAQDNLDQANKSGLNGMISVMKQNLEDAQSILDAAKQIDYPRNNKLKEMAADKEFQGIINPNIGKAGIAQIMYDFNLNEEQVYDIISANRPEELSYNTVLALVLANNLKQSNQTVDQKIESIQKKINEDKQYVSDHKWGKSKRDQNTKESYYRVIKAMENELNTFKSNKIAIEKVLNPVMPDAPNPLMEILSDAKKEYQEKKQAAIEVPVVVDGYTENKQLEREVPFSDKDNPEEESSDEPEDNSEMSAEEESEGIELSGKLQDFGQKIGLARKDVSEKGFTRMGKGKEESQPAWSKKYKVFDQKNMAVVERIGWNRPSLDPEKFSIVIVKGNRFRTIRENVDSEQEAYDMIPLLEVSINHRVYPSEKNKDQFSIYRKWSSGKLFEIKKGFESKDEAMLYLAEHPQEIINYKTLRVERPHLDSIERTGPERRKGNVTPEQFMDTFGLRAGEFGNWVAGDERQEMLNFAFDAFADMAEVLGVPYKAISLNGRLAIGFGSRGQGLSGASAHFEPQRGVINLTKINGAGALAHEWFHAFDSYLGIKDRKGYEPNESGVISAIKDERDYNSQNTNYKLREELKHAWRSVWDTMRYKSEQSTYDKSKAEKRRNHAVESLMNGLNSAFSSAKVERSYGLRKKAATPEQVKRWDTLIERVKNFDFGEVSKKETKKRYSYEQQYDVQKQLNDLYKEITGREISTYNMSYNNFKSIELYNEEIKRAEEGQTFESKVSTTFYRDSVEMDKVRASSYWSTNHEMSARAFEAFMDDQIKVTGFKNDYLVHSVNNGIYQFIYDCKPYPEGEERTKINESFKAFFSTIETKVEDNGNVPMYSILSDVWNKIRNNPTPERIFEKVDELQNIAPNAAPVILVNTYDELPEQYQEDQDNETVGFYVDGNVYIIADRIKSIDHLVATWIHENGIHHGLKNIVPGGEYRKLMVDVYDSFSEIAKDNKQYQDIIDFVDEHYDGLNKAEKAEEFLAYLSERIITEKDLSPMEQTAWDKFIQKFRQWIGRLFNFNSNILSEREIRNIVRASVQSNFQNNERSDSNQAAGRKVRKGEQYDSLGGEGYSDVQENIRQSSGAESTDDIRSGRVLSENGENTGIKELPKKAKATGLGLLEFLKAASDKVKQAKRRPQKVRTRKDRFVSRFINGNNAVKILLEKFNLKVPDHANIFLALNQKSSRQMGQKNSFEKKLYNPLLRSVEKIMVVLEKQGLKKEEAYNKVSEYLMASHAPERNEWFRSLGKKGNNFAGMTDQQARAIFEKFESEVPAELINDLWNRTRECTERIAKYYTEYGKYSEASLNTLMDRNWDHYVPLRGFEPVANEIQLDYERSEKRSEFAGDEKTEGRESMADDPIAYIYQMATSAIMWGEKNKAKKSAYNLIKLNSSRKDLFEMSQINFMKDNIGMITEVVYEPSGNYTDKKGNEKPDHKVFLMNTDNEGNTKKTELGLKSVLEDTGYKFSSSRVADLMNEKPSYLRKQHEVEVYIDGNKFKMIFKDPAISNAINGDNYSQAINFKYLPIASITRFMSRSVTSWRPSFITSNTYRDFKTGAKTIFIQRGFKDSLKFQAKYGTAAKFLASNMLNDAWRNSGKTGDYLLDVMQLEPKTEEEKLWKKWYDEYNVNGGPTGHAYLMPLDEVKSKVERFIKHIKRSKTDKLASFANPMNALKLMEGLAGYGESIARFTAYVMAREKGESIMQSINEAKEISTNFDSRGEYAASIGSFIMFFNASIQGAAKQYDMAKNHTFRYFAINAVSLVVQGMLARFLWDLFNPDDDDNDYAEINKYTMYNNTVLGWKDNYVSIPLAQGYRVWNALGVALYEHHTGRLSTEQMAFDMSEVFSQALSPVEISGIFDKENKLSAPKAAGVLFSAIRPLMDVSINENYQKKAIYREPFLKSQEGKYADSQMHFNNTNALIVSFTRWLYKQGGGDPELGTKTNKGKRILEAYDWNPAKIEHILKAYSGGPGETVLDAANYMILKIVDDFDKRNKDSEHKIEGFDPTSIPILQTYYHKKYTGLMYNEYRDLANQAEVLKFEEERRRLTKNEDDEPELSEDQLDFIDDYELANDEINELLEDKKAATNEDEKKVIDLQILGLRRGFVSKHKYFGKN